MRVPFSVFQQVAHDFAGLSLSGFSIAFNNSDSLFISSVCSAIPTLVWPSDRRNELLARLRLRVTGPDTMKYLYNYGAQYN